MITVLQAGRFLAALAVVIHHASVSVGFFVEKPPEIVTAVAEFGYLGVDFFFVLSGFIIHYSMATSKRSAADFAYSRLTRIFLPYWPIGLCLAAVYTLLPNLSAASDSSWGWISTITLFPTSYSPALSVAWTLQHELLFYVVYAALFYFGRIALGFAIWATSIVIALPLFSPQYPLLQLFLAPINIEFMAGILACALFVRGIRCSGILAAILACVFLGIFIILGAHRDQSVFFGLAIAVMLPYLCEMERAGRITIPDFFVWGGSVSYAVYLVHNPLLSITSRLQAGHVGWETALILSVVLSVAAGTIFYRFWERPLMRLAKRLWHR